MSKNKGVSVLNILAGVAGLIVAGVGAIGLNDYLRFPEPSRLTTAFLLLVGGLLVLLLPWLLSGRSAKIPEKAQTVPEAAQQPGPERFAELLGVSRDSIKWGAALILLLALFAADGAVFLYFFQTKGPPLTLRALWLTSLQSVVLWLALLVSFRYLKERGLATCALAVGGVTGAASLISTSISGMPVTLTHFILAGISGLLFAVCLAVALGGIRNLLTALWVGYVAQSLLSKAIVGYWHDHPVWDVVKHTWLLSVVSAAGFALIAAGLGWIFRRQRTAATAEYAGLGITQILADAWPERREGGLTGAAPPPEVARPSTTDDLCAKGASLLNEERFPEAVETLERAVAERPDSPLANYLLAEARSRAAPKDASEEQLKAYFVDVVAPLEKVVDHRDARNTLSARQYGMACLMLSSLSRIMGNPELSIRAARLGLEADPDDDELLGSLATTLLEENQLAEAEEVVDRLVRVTPERESTRKLWKRIRKARGKTTDSERPEEEKQRIYYTYHDHKQILDTDVMIRMAGDRVHLDQVSAGGLLALVEHMASASERVRKEQAGNLPEDKVQREFDLSPFELQLILAEGERLDWAVPDPGSRDLEPRARMRDELHCVYCGKSNPAPYWPPQGDWKAFYNQSAERTREEPGAFRLPIECPHCHETWFVVWDDNPDPVAQPFVRHIERMCDDHPDLRIAHQTWRRLIADDALGVMMSFLRQSDELQGALEAKKLVEHSFTAAGHRIVLTVVPAADPRTARELLGGSYLHYVDSHLKDWNREEHHFVHFILCVDDENAGLHVLYFPRAAAVQDVPTITPVDLFTPEEVERLQGLSR